jgi:hypothetical protein
MGSFTKDQMKAGRALLRDLLPAAREAAATQEYGLEVMSGVAQAGAPYLREDNFEAIVIYPAPLGGFHCDLLLKKTPTGVANTMGSPVAKPLPTREAALDYAHKILTGMLARERLNAAEPAAAEPSGAAPVFELFGADMPILPVFTEVAQDLRQTIETLQRSPFTYDDALAMLAEATSEYLPDGDVLKAARKLNQRQRMNLVISVHLANLVGVFRFPQRSDGTPSGHKETGTMQ